MKPFFLIFFSFLPYFSFALDENAENERDRLSQENLAINLKEESAYRAAHKDWSTSQDYLRFQIQQTYNQYFQRKKMYEDLCLKFNSYCNIMGDSHVRTRDDTIERLKLNFQLLKKVRDNQITRDDSRRFSEEFYIKQLMKECQEFKSLCKLFEEKKLAYKKAYSKDFDPSSVINVVPMDFGNQIDVENIKYESDVTAKIQLEDKKTLEAPIDTRNYDPDTCEWVEDLPRRIVKGPGCNVGGATLCVGFVICKQKVGEGKFVRMSTCGSENCGTDDAKACTKQKGYGSSKPTDETKHTVSGRAKEMMSSKGKVE
jgi:hypothetical protein